MTGVLMQNTWPRLLVGGTMIFVGVFLILVNIGLMDADVLWRYWPVILIVIGLAKMFQEPGSCGRRDGYWFVVLGLWFQLSVLNVFGWGFGDSWPLLVVAWGARILWDEIDKSTSIFLAQEKNHGG
jgi:hypothetical protein